MKPISGVLATAAVLFAATPNVAEADNEGYSLLKHKAWEVSLQETAEQTLYCQAKVVNRAGDSLHLVGYPDEPLMMFVFLTRSQWSRTFQGNAEFDIDYIEWTLENADFRDADADFIKFTFAGDDSTMEFLEDLHNGTAIALKSPRRSRSLATFSLAGSAAALAKLSECWSRVRVSASADTYDSAASDSY